MRRMHGILSLVDPAGSRPGLEFVIRSSPSCLGCSRVHCGCPAAAKEIFHQVHILAVLVLECEPDIPGLVMFS